MKVSKWLVMSLLVMTTSSAALADGLLENQNCIPVEDSPATHALESFDIQNIQDAQTLNEMQMAGFELSCKKVYELKDLYDYTDVVLGLPAMAFTAGMLKIYGGSVEALMASIGVTITAPTVLSISLVGASGAFVVKVFMKKKLEDCRRMDQEKFKDELIKALRDQYGWMPKNNFQIHYR
jgi:hypothetical protein